MPITTKNPHRGTGMLPDAPTPSTNAGAVAALLAKCPAHSETPLVNANGVAKAAGVAEVWVKDERSRMGLGSFKALGAAYVIARHAADKAQDDWGPTDWATALSGETFVTASAGNHGLSVAAGARVFGASAVIYIAETVPADFEKRLAGFGARVERTGADYAASMEAAEAAAQTNGWSLLSDSTWDDEIAPGMGVMEGYLQIASEAAAQIPASPTHILLQAGVGGLAAAVAAQSRATWGDGPTIYVVEPAFAPALVESIKAGALVTADGPVSSMGRLDCKTPSLVALAGLSRDADHFVTITEKEAATGIAALAPFGLETSPSGGAALAALLTGLDLPKDARVLAYLSEGPVDD